MSKGLVFAFIALIAAAAFIGCSKTEVANSGVEITGDAAGLDKGFDSVSQEVADPSAGLPSDQDINAAIE